MLTHMLKQVDPRTELRRTVRTFYPTQRAAAEALGISGAYLSDMLNGRRDCSEAILKKLGLTSVVVRKAGSK